MTSEDSMVTVLTNAPDAYDYSYVTDFGPVEIELYPGRTISGRKVTMPSRSVAYQIGRYSSGNYVVQVQTRRCVGCFQQVHPVTQSGHAQGCPTGQNGNPNYS